jgi:hypothetical protein
MTIWPEKPEEPHQFASSTAHLKFLHRRWQILPRNFKRQSGTGINKLANAYFPKFVCSASAPSCHELRKVGISPEMWYRKVKNRLEANFGPIEITRDHC